MTLDEYRRQIGWSLSEMARNAGIDFNTLKRAMDGESVSPQTARKLAAAISKALGETVRIADIEGLNANL